MKALAEMNPEMITGVDFVRTRGLGLARAEGEICLTFTDETNGDSALDLCSELVQYIESTNRTFRDGDSIAWATSVLTLRRERNVLTAYELNVDTDHFERGIDRTLNNWISQKHICSLANSRYVETKLEDMIIVSPDLVAAGGTIREGVRYPFMPPNSGWWIFGCDFSGDMAAVQRLHVGHVVQHYPSIIRYLGLAPGFCFRPPPAESVWFELEVAKAEAI